MPRPLRFLARVIAALVLVALLVGLPLLVVVVVGLPLPTVAQLRAVWSAQRIDADVVVRLGAAVFVVLWAWFAVTAVAELWRVMSWRHARTTTRLRPVPPGPAGWVRSLVRFVAISSVSAGALVSGLAATVRPAAAAPHSPPAAPRAAVAASFDHAAPHGAAVGTPTTSNAARPSRVANGRDTPYSLAVELGDPGLRQHIIELNTGRAGPDGRPWSGGVFPAGMEVELPGEATVMTPLGPAHEVVPGDCYWAVAEDHLADVLGREPTSVEVWEYTDDLIGVNAPLLGHDDHTLVLPGELMILPVVVEPAAAADDDVHDARPVLIPIEAPAAAEPPTAPAPPAAPNTPASPEVPANLPAATDLPAAADAAEPPVVVVVERSSTAPFLAGVGTATLFAAGGLGLLESRRRQRLRTAALGARLHEPTPAAAQAEVALRALGAAERAARLDMALRVAAPALAAQDTVITAALVSPEGAIRLHLRGHATPNDGWWRLDIGDGSWRLPAEVDLAELATAACTGVHPCPGLVHLGLTDGGDCFVDLEALGILAVESPHAAPLLRALAASLDLSPFVGSGRVAVVGLDLPVGADSRTDQLDSLDAAVEAAAIALGSTAATARGRSTFALRVAGVGGEAWEPSLIIAAGEQPADGLAALLAAAAPSRGLAAALEGPVPGATWVLRADDDGHVLEPLHLRIEPIGLDVEEVAAVHQLLAAEAEPALVAPVPLVRPHTAAPFVEPAWDLLVRVFGQVEVVDRDGRAAVFERSKAQELVVWLSQHRERPTRHAARAALWDLTVRDATFANVVSDARRALARTVPPPDGEEWIARTLTEDLPLHAGVLSDAELLQRRVEHARGLRPHDAIEVLAPAVELLAGMPFAGTGFLWCDAEGLSSALSLLAVDAAGTLAQHCLAVGDLDRVFWATGQGLKVIGGHEALVDLRMRAHARRGDLAGVRQEWESYERALAADTFLMPEPSPKLVALRRELLAPSLAG